MNKKNVIIFLKIVLLFVFIGILFDLIFDLKNLNIWEIISELISSIVFAIYATYMCRNITIDISQDRVLANMSKYGTVVKNTEEYIEWKLHGIKGFYFNKAFYDKKICELETSRIIIKKFI